ncbi:MULTISPECIES: hypothetical protein [Aestuariibaculum]|uniref:DinB family protein n=1 Tax=Aestuariibaculum lutulentum TaxID=2920935 RepID=A0ABS9RDP3_9FLAO|nr:MULTISPECIES: hypothetical protein [Aestuariibaculum]MCH4551061.1 hypothetical protein [Aestuariibaculum lutulentum]MCR8666124.1 hypothetical protein [Aestuariibaculum sp. M13]
MRYIIIMLFSMVCFAQTQNDLPYYEIPEAPEVYTPATAAARMIDGLGFRYYWATEGLRLEDLAYKIGPDSRTSGETIEHIYGLSKFIRNSVLAENKDDNKNELSFELKRKQTLMNLKLVSDALKNNQGTFDLANTEVPFWNIINGPIEDAVWHCGQVVMLRRASGNPFTSNVNLFSGKVKTKN